MSANDEVIAVIRELERSRFWGSFEIQFQAGVASLLRKTETLKPQESSLRNNRGVGNDKK